MDFGSLKQPENRRKIARWVVIAIFLIIYDIVAIHLSYFAGLFLRFDFHWSSIPKEYLDAFQWFTPFYSVFCILVFMAFRLYMSIWRYASFSELKRSFFANVLTSGVHIIGITLIFRQMPISYYVVGFILQFCFVTFIRFAYRFLRMEKGRRAKNHNAAHRVMIIGAGEAGRVIAKELITSEKDDAIPVCFIDDNKNKWRRNLLAVPIHGGRETILEAVKKYNCDRIIFAIPTAKPEDKREILNICSETDCELHSLPALYQLTNGEVSVSQLKPVAIEDLLGREMIRVNMDEIFAQLKGKRILVTGGGGSIGSELCRQIAAHEPEQLVIFDIYENNAYDIEQELKRKYGDRLNLVTLIGSVRDTRRIESVFETYRPQVVYHAAAHKHVPLMETSPYEAIKNNVLGTYKTAFAAMKYGTERFVLISTDKAVNPTNIMGCSKRMCEMVIQTMDYISKYQKYDMLRCLMMHYDEDTEKILDAAGVNDTGVHTQFVAVRFGNVLGSNGSVIPLFKKQIEDGGPVTVTHPDIIRYFMTIPEAVSLVLQAGTYAKGGEIFVLDMGEPVKIDTMARNLIRLSGFTPDVDIKIVYTGLRPGEKLYEEKLMAEEGLQTTDNALIHIGKPIDFDREEFLDKLCILAEAAYANDNRVFDLAKEIVPTFTHE